MRHMEFEINPAVRRPAGRMGFWKLPRGDALVMGSARDAPAVDLDAFFATADGDTAVVAGGGESAGLGGYFELGGTATAPPLQASGGPAQQQPHGLLVPALLDRRRSADIQSPPPARLSPPRHLEETRKRNNLYVGQFVPKEFCRRTAVYSRH